MARHDEVRGQLLRELDELRREASTTYCPRSTWLMAS